MESILPKLLMHIVYMYSSYPISAKFINSKSVRSFSFSWPPPYFHHDAFTHHVQPVGLLDTGASIPPEAMMHFPPVSDFPILSKKFQNLRKIFKMLPFFSHRPQIANCPLFSLFWYISLCFAKIIISPPTFKNFPPVFEKFT